MGFDSIILPGKTILPRLIYLKTLDQEENFLYTYEVGSDVVPYSCSWSGNLEEPTICEETGDYCCLQDNAIRLAEPTNPYPVLWQAIVC